MPKISELPVAGPIGGTELLVCVQVGTTKQTTVNDVITGSGAGGPTWTTPASGALVWRNVSFSANVTLTDAGAFDVVAPFATNQAYGDNVTPVIGRFVTSTGVFHIRAEGNGKVVLDSATFTTAFVAIDDATGTFQIGNWQTCIYQLTGINATFWGGTGAPTDLNNAIDRIASVVSSGGAFPIP